MESEERSVTSKNNEHREKLDESEIQMSEELEKEIVLKIIIPSSYLLSFSLSLNVRFLIRFPRTNFKIKRE